MDRKEQLPGCSFKNWRHHMCGYSTQIQEILKCLYQIAKDNMDSFDEDLANFK